MTHRFLLLFGLTMAAGAVNAAPIMDGDAQAGQQKSAQCAACHGPKGNMESAQFPKLAGQGAPYIYEQLMLFKSGKRNNAVMKGQVAGLNEKDMKNLAVYFASQQTRPGAADETVAPAGAVLYHGGKADKNIPACAGCHGPSGLGNAAARFPRLSGQNPQYIVAQLTAYRENKRSGYRNATIMNGVAQNLKDADIKALASYVAGLAPASDKTGSGHGALMQNVGGPSAASAGGATGKISGGGSDSGATAAADKAEAGSGNAGGGAADDSADKAEGEDKNAGNQNAAGGDQAASGADGKASESKATGQDSAAGKDSAKAAGGDTGQTEADSKAEKTKAGDSAEAAKPADKSAKKSQGNGEAKPQQANQADADADAGAGRQDTGSVAPDSPGSSASEANSAEASGKQSNSAAEQASDGQSQSQPENGKASGAQQ